MKNQHFFTLKPQRVGFTKIHRFKYSARPQSAAKALYKPDKALTPKIIASRLEQIRQSELTQTS